MSNSRFKISDQNDIEKIRKNPGSTFYIEEDIILKDDFDIIEHFYGNINGRGHTIYVSHKSSSFEGGMINQNDGILSNLNVVNSYKTNDCIVGGLVSINYGEIEKCSYCGYIRGDCEDIGGIAGQNFGNIENCKFSGRISGGYSIGGIAGLNSINGDIIECSSKGIVYNGESELGGIVGNNYAEVNLCHFSGEVLDCENLGCIVGVNNKKESLGSGSVKSCFWIEEDKDWCGKNKGYSDDIHLVENLDEVMKKITVRKI